MSERLTSPLTVGVELRKRLSAQRWAATYSHGGSQGFKSPPLHPCLVTSGNVGRAFGGVPFWPGRPGSEHPPRVNGHA